VFVLRFCRGAELLEKGLLFRQYNTVYGGLFIGCPAAFLKGIGVDSRNP